MKITIEGESEEIAEFFNKKEKSFNHELKPVVINGSLEALQRVINQEQ